MKFEFFIKSLADAKKVILILAFACGAMILINLVLVAFCFSLSHRDQTVLVPMHLNAPTRISNQYVSKSYLRDVALSFVDLRLNFDPDTVKKNHETILQFVYPSDYAQIKSMLAAEEQMVISQGLSSSFDVTKLSVNPQTLQVKVSGILHRALNKKPLPNAHATFVLSFINDEGFVGLSGFQEIKKVRRDI